METKVEGILLRKVPYQDRHIIGTLLLRNGRKVSLLFFGGQGGGKKLRPSSLELGYMLKVELKRSKSTGDLYRAKEWIPLWRHENIRLNYKSFYLLCFFLEVMEKISIDDDLHDSHRGKDLSMLGSFRVLSNALVHLDKRALQKETFNKYSELVIFFTKLLIEQGVFPERKSCFFCGKELKESLPLYLLSEHGGFGCFECLGDFEKEGGHSFQEGQELWKLLGLISHRKYLDLKEIEIQSARISQVLFSYFLHQFQFQREQFKGAKAVL